MLQHSSFAERVSLFVLPVFSGKTTFERHQKDRLCERHFPDTEGLLSFCVLSSSCTLLQIET